MRELEHAQEQDIFRDWSGTKFRNYRKKKCHYDEPLHVELEVYRSTKDKLLIWDNYVSSLYYDSVSPDNGDLYCTSHAEYIERSVSDMLRAGGENDDDLVMVNVFTVDEVCRDISRLKLDTKGGDDGLNNEHLKFGGYQLALYLTNLLNGIYRASFAPLAMKRGLICTRSGVKYWCQDMVANVVLNGKISRDIQIKQSVRQGSILGSWLYMLYIHDL